MEMPYFVLNESLGETFIEEDNTPREEALVYVKKGVLNLTVCVVSSGRNFMVGVEENDTIGFLCRKIGEEMESFDQFKGVMGLRARNLRLRGTTEVVSNLMERVHTHFRDGDEVLCELQSEDLWMKCDVHYHSTFMREWTASFELRVKQDSSVFELRRMVQKVAINFWNIGITSSQLYRRHITIMKSLEVAKREGIMEASLSAGVNLQDLSDLEKIRDHFSFECWLDVTCKFTTLEDEFNQQNPNFQKLHSRMLGFFGVGIPRKTSPVKLKDEEEDTATAGQAQDTRSWYKKGERTDDPSEQLIRAKTPLKVSSVPLHQTGPIRDSTQSVGSSESHHPSNIVYENVVLPHLQTTFEASNFELIEDQIDEQKQDASSSNTSSKSVLLPAREYQPLEREEMKSTLIEEEPTLQQTNSAEAGFFKSSKRRSTKRTYSFLRKTEHTHGGGESSQQRGKRLKGDQEKMLKMVRLPTFLLNSKELRTTKVIVRNKKLHIGEDHSKSSVYEQSGSREEEPTRPVKDDSRKKCFILLFVTLTFILVVIIALVFELS